MKIGKENIIKFKSANFLTDYKGKCRRLHGHNYFGDVIIDGCELKNGILEGIDFSDIKKIVERINKTLDHRILVPIKNKDVKLINRRDNCRLELTNMYIQREYIGPIEDFAIIPVRYTTAEELSIYIRDEIFKELKHKNVQVIVKLYETETSFAEG